MEAPELSSSALTESLKFDQNFVRLEAGIEGAAVVGAAAGEGGVVIGGGEKRKRGRPRGQVATVPKVALEEEDVCFICFDGGSLVLCDKRGCPKAYHPTCIKRDEAFFRSKAKWNCGWHICSVCQKSSHYMCYTCTYSLCKGCTMDADYVCVKGNMGFCSTCMRTIMLIENKDQANKESVQVDFDDKTSWEYLFKMYWNFLKERLSLTLDELTQAENPCKGVRSLATKRMLPDLKHGVSNRNRLCSNTSCEQLDSKDPKNLVEPTSKDSAFAEIPIKATEKLSNENYASDIICDAWASKELLDFVAHMKDGDTSTMSQFGVQELLLEYIKKNNLRDPHKKSQIICDLRLMSLFGKARVGHIEMLKLIEFHFLIKDDSQNSFIPAGIVGADAIDLVAEENNKSALLSNKNKQRKNRKKIEVRTPQNNLDEYAAIDVHNINLIYLRRNLMENLTQEEKFLEKVIGSVVRIRILSSDPKQDIYRLVQVVGTNQVPAPYKVGNKTVDVVLEVLNLDKKEVIAIDAVSNQDFSQDECRRLRQSIRCGLVKHLTVGDIEKKAMELLTVRLDDCLEAEKLKLNHLRDRASEKGRKKDLRECVEKLQLLDTPEERQRRLSEIPEVHADPKMNPEYESEPDVGVSDQKQDEYMRSKPIEFGRSKHRQINGKRKVQHAGPITGQLVIARKKGASNLSSQAVVRTGPETPAATLATGSSSPVNDGEIEKLWHYRDPNGNIQGPFSMVQLRKWSTTGYFPPDMSIWRSHEQKESILLTDALNGRLPTAAHLLYNTSLQSKQTQPASDNQISDAKWNHRTDRHKRDVNQIVQPLQSSVSGVQLNNNECRRIDVSGSMSSGFPASTYRNKEIQPKDLPPSGLRENKLPSSHTGLRHPLSLSNNGPLVSNRHGVLGYGNVGPPSSPSEKKASKAAIHIVAGQPGEMKSDNSHEDQSSGQNGRSLPINLNSSEMDLNSGSALAIAGSCGETCNTEPCESPNSALKVNSQESEFVVADLKSQSLNPKSPPQASDIPSLPSPTPETPNENQGGQIAESKQPGNSMFQDSSPSWSNSSTLVVSSTQLPDKTDDWGGHSPTPAKPLVEEWSSGLVSASLMKQPKEMGDQATPVSNIDTLNSPSHITSNVTSWHGVETIEFTTLGEESVSDLLAEVDAMESRSGLGSPTSTMRCGDELKGFKNECFSIDDDDLNLTLDPGKGDAWSSTGDIQVTCQSIATKDTFGVFGSDAYDHLKRSSRHSSTSSDGETRSAEFSHNNHAEAGSTSHPFPTGDISQDVNVTGVPPGNGLEKALENVIGKTHDHMNLVVEPSAQGVSDVSLDSNQGGWVNPNTNPGSISGYGGHQWDDHRRYEGERHPISRDWPTQGGGDVDFGRGRLLGNRQPSGGEAGEFSRPPLKGQGQRVCKFYGSGHCKKGASCGYLHP